ncbi:MAG: hypothetical protein K9G41_08515 [Flavobacteriales bacterium]|nr:hypothetical protein [Flavobacteriales bacterium]
MNRVVLKTFLLACIICPQLLLGQNLSFSEVRWGNEGEVKTKLHIKEALEFEGKSIAELHDLLERWYFSEIFDKGRGYSYRFHGVSGDFMWQSDTKKPFLVNEPDWIIPKAIKCDNCMLAWPNAKLKDRVDGVYALDLRIKEGKVLLVVADHYIFTENSFLSDWLHKKKELVNTSDDRIAALEIEFKRLKENMVEFIHSYTEPQKDAVKKGVDDW